MNYTQLNVQLRHQGLLSGLYVVGNVPAGELEDAIIVSHYIQ